MLAAITERLDLGVILLDARQNIVLCNAWICERAGLDATSCVGGTLASVFGPSVDPRLSCVVRDALSFGCAARLSHAFHPSPLPLHDTHSAGDKQPERIKQGVDVLPVQYEGNAYCIIQVRDLTSTVRRERLLRQQAKQLRNDLQRLEVAQEELRRSELRFRELARMAPAGLFETDAQGRCVYFNERASALTSLSTGDIIGKHWTRFVPDSERERLSVQWTRARESGTRFAEEFTFTHADGRSLRLRAEAGPVRNTDQAVTHFVGTLLDITEYHEHAQRNEYRANHDALTALCNRERFDTRLRAAVSGSEAVGQHFALLFLDLDGFKAVNDSLGHESGDMVLRTIAARLRKVCRSEDTVARYGGDEFAILVTDMPDAQSVQHVANKVRQVIALPIEVGCQHVRVSAAIGIALFPQDGADAQTLMRYADAAMYQAKRGQSTS